MKRKTDLEQIAAAALHDAKDLSECSPGELLHIHGWIEEIKFYVDEMVAKVRSAA